jgi:hypothetical protein
LGAVNDNRNANTRDEKMATMKIKGIISAERPCELCGNKQLEKNVVLENADTGELLYVGTTCAGYLVHGKKTAKNSKLIADEAAAIGYAAKWTKVHGNSEGVLQKIASAIRVHFCPATVHHGELLIGSQM